MIIQSCMLEADAPRVMTMSLVADGHAVIVTFSLRAWTLIDAASQSTLEFWEGGLERRDDRITLRIPIHASGSPQWRHTQVALGTFRQIVEALRLVDLSGLREGGASQLVWIDALLVRFHAADIAVVASPTFAAFIRAGSTAMFQRVSAAMIRAERTMFSTNDVPRTRGASCHNGTLHLLVGNDCACVGVSNAELPRSDREGWVAHGHNLDTVHRILLVLVALAALEDECRAQQTN